MRALTLLLAIAMAACAHSSAAPAEPAAPGSEAKAGCCDNESCPMGQDGMQVVYEDTSDGAAMVFTATDVPGLQARIAKMAEKHGTMDGHHGEHHEHGKGEHHEHGKGEHHDAPPVPHSARADNTATGARLVMTPTDAAQLDALRTHVREHVEMMQRGECPMKAGHH